MVQDIFHALGYLLVSQNDFTLLKVCIPCSNFSFVCFLYDLSFDDSPWAEGPCKDAAEKNVLGGLSFEGFLSQVFNYLVF